MHTEFNQSSAGAVTPAASFQITNGRSILAEATVRFRGTGTAYVQLHDVASGGTPSNATLREGAGFLVDDDEHKELFLNWDRPLLFVNGARILLSSTQDTYTASAQTMIVTAQWGGGS